MNKYLLSLMVLLPLSTFVYAQDDADEEAVEEIVTTGIKSSLKDAIDIKRKNVGVVDAISAEDIGKFPDGNLAESLARLVGVTTERSNDEGTKISVRGLGPEFNLVTLNGRSMPTVPGRYVGGRSFNFGDISAVGVSAVEVYKSANATLPTGGLGSTVNMVTTKPLDIDGDSIGTVSMKAYDHSKGDNITPEVDFVYAMKNVGDDISWGFSLSGSHQDRENREDGTNEIPWVPMVDEGLTYRIPGNAAITNNNQRADGDFFHPEYINYRFKNNTRIRNNAQTAFQIEVGKVKATLDYTWSDVEFGTEGVQWGSYFGGWNLREAVINERGVVVSALETHQENDVFYGESLTNKITWGENKSSNKSIGLNIEIAATDSLTLEIDYHDSSAAKKGNPDGSWGDNFVSFTGGSWPGFGDGGIYEQAGSMFDRRFDFNNQVGALSYINKRYYCCDANGLVHISDVTEFEAQDMVAREGAIVYEDKRSDNSQLQFNGTWDNEAGFLMESLVSVDFGVSRLKQNFVAQKYQNDMRGASYLVPGNPIMLAYGLWDNSVFTKVNLDNFLGSGTGSSYLDISPEQAQYLFERTGWVSGTGQWFHGVSPDTYECTANDAVDADGNPNGLRDANGNQTTSRGVMCKGAVDSDESVSEVIESIYANLNFEYTTSNGGEVRAQVGLRYEDVTRSSYGAAALPLTTIWGFGDFGYNGVQYGPAAGSQGMVMVDASAPSRFVNTGSSDSFLPNVNVSYEFAENQLVRFSASKTLARPALETLSSSFTMSQFTPLTPRQVFSGNSNLQPYTAENYDISYEYYYKEGSYFALNYFRKDISDYHGSGQGTTSFAGVYDVAAGDLAAGITPETSFSALAGWGDWWINQIQDGAWLLGTGLSYVCAGSSRSASGCVASDYGNPNAVFVASASDGDPLYQFEVFQPVNKYDGTLDGIEVAVQHLFDNNFGVLANATFVGGDTDVDAAYIGEQFALPGFGDAANLSVFYEDENYSARISYNLKAETYAGMDSYNPLFVEERGQVDFSASYYVNDNAVVFIEAQNVTDEDVRLFARHKEMLFLYQDQGPVYKAGFRYKF